MMPQTQTFEQQLRDAKANYRLVKLLRDAANGAAEAVDMLERIYVNIGGALSPKEYNQINADYNVVKKWVQDSKLPPIPQPASLLAG